MQMLTLCDRKYTKTSFSVLIRPTFILSLLLLYYLSFKHHQYVHLCAFMQISWVFKWQIYDLPPEFDLLCSSEDGGDAAGVHLQESHLSWGVRGQQGGASSLSPLHVPAGQTQLEALSVLQEPLTQSQADATAGRHTQCNEKHIMKAFTDCIYKQNTLMYKTIQVVGLDISWQGGFKSWHKDQFPTRRPTT